MKSLMIFTLGIALFCLFCLLMVAGAAVGIVASNNVFARPDIFPLKLSEFDLGFLVVVLVLLLFVWRPRNLVPFFAFALISVIWFFFSAQWDTSVTGSATQFARQIQFGSDQPLDLSVLIISACLSAFICLNLTVLSNKMEAFSLQIYLLFWRQRYPLIWSAIKNDSIRFKEPSLNKMKLRIYDPTYRRTPLHWACFFNHVELAQDILNLDPSLLSIADFDKNLPIHYAVIAKVELLKVVLRANGSLWSVNKHGVFPLERIIFRKNMENLRAFMDFEPTIPKHLIPHVLKTLQKEQWHEGHQYLEKHLVLESKSQT